MSRIVIALGGNALGYTVEEQKRMSYITSSYIYQIIKEGHEVVLTHGNGPQVGLINLSFEEGSKINDKIYSMPFPECGAMSQGYIGYHLQNSLFNVFKENNYTKNIVTLITQVEVDANDSAFKNPTKPIGSFYSKDEAAKKEFPMIEDAKRGYRRVVASPKPINIIEAEAIKQLISNGFIVITVGGGGIPVIMNNGKLKGVDAVIDKDFASCQLAKMIDADILLILTNVEKVSINYKKDNQKELTDVSVDEAYKYIENNEFYAGSMLPKVEACLDFINNSNNKTAIITSIEHALDAINNHAGTRFYK